MTIEFSLAGLVAGSHAGSFAGRSLSGWPEDRRLRSPSLIPPTRSPGRARRRIFRQGEQFRRCAVVEQPVDRDQVEEIKQPAVVVEMRVGQDRRGEVAYPG